VHLAAGLNHPELARKSLNETENQGVAKRD